MQRLVLTAMALLIATPHVARAIELQPVAAQAGKALLDRSTPSPSGTQVQIGVVKRSRINKDLFVDIVGLRLWTDSADSAKRLRSCIVASASALALKQKLCATIMEPGVEPDMIPVRGQEGKKAGAEGRVLIEGGEYTREGEYRDASGGGLGKDSAGISFRCVKSVVTEGDTLLASKAAIETEAEPKSPELAKIDQPVRDFRLRDLMQDEPAYVTLSQYREKKTVVLVSVQSRCPITWKYIGRIGQLLQDFHQKDVAFLAIRSSLTDSEDRIRRYAEDKNLDMPLLYDEENRVADYFGTQGTPYFYVIDKQGVLRYEGICDNNQVPKRVDLKPESVTSQYVRDAIEAVLAGKPVKTKSVPAGST